MTASDDLWDEGWVLHTDDLTDYHPPTLANGMIGLVASARVLQIEQVILGEVYDISPPDNVPKILPGIDCLSLDLEIEDLRSAAADAVQDWQQRLNLPDASLTTTFTLAQKVAVTHTLCTLRHLPHTALVSLNFTALDDVTLAVHHSLAVPEALQPQAQQFHFYHEVPNTPLFSSTALSPTGRHIISAAVAYLFEGEMPAFSHETISDRLHSARFSVKLSRGETYHLGLIASICTTAHFADPIHEAERLSIFARFEGEARLWARHQAAWAELWTGDIVIEGDPVAQREVRFALYNLYAFVRAGSRASIPPMGLSSVGYNGHIFWDAELRMYPPLLVLQPKLARSLIDYRTDRLNAARRKAQSYGYQGAMYPWESDDRGEECTPTWAVTGPSEHHITACVGIAFWNYYRVTRDQVWLEREGYPVLREVADFWLSRVERNAAGQYEIKRVVGADEYTGVVDNNAFTNGAAATVLAYAALAAEELGRSPDPRWREVAGQIALLRFEDGVTQEYTGYDGRVIKQADVNLLAYPLDLVHDEAQIRRDLDYYEPRFDENAPAMSHCVLSVIAARLGDRERAEKFFWRSYRPNQKPPFGVLSETPFSHNPYFATAAGGLLQAVLFGLAGLELTDQGLVQRQPCLPANWTSLTLRGYATVFG